MNTFRCAAPATRRMRGAFLARLRRAFILKCTRLGLASALLFIGKTTMPRIRELIDVADAYRQNLREKQAEKLLEIFEEALSLFETWRSSTTELQLIREKINANTKAFKETKDNALIEETRELKGRMKDLQTLETESGERLKKLERALPNWHHSSVPVGVEGDEQVMCYSGTPSVWAEEKELFAERYPGVEAAFTAAKPYHHYNLVGGQIDQEIAGEIAETKFYFEFDELVLLDMALSMYAIEYFRNAGYGQKLMIPPYMMRRAVEEEICYIEAFEDTIFEVQGGLILMPSSEHSIVAYYKDRIFEKEELPLRILAWSPCFRREAGSHGKDTRGIFRVKQFHKVELHTILPQDGDLDEVEHMRAAVEGFLGTLGLPNRSIVVASGDMDKRAVKQVDVETWMPGQCRYRETHSIATLGTWVSEKSKIRYRADEKKILPTYNVYGTALAVQRMMCAITENHYDPEKSVVRIPEVLHKYMCGVTEIPVARG